MTFGAGEDQNQPWFSGGRTILSVPQKERPEAGIWLDSRFDGQDCPSSPHPAVDGCKACDGAPIRWYHRFSVSSHSACFPHMRRISVDDDEAGPGDRVERCGTT